METIVIVILILALVGVTIFAMVRDTQLEQREGYIRRLEAENTELRAKRWKHTQ